MQTLSSKEQLFATLQLISRVVTHAQPIKRESYTWKHPLAGRIKFIFDGCPLVTRSSRNSRYLAEVVNLDTQGDTVGFVELDS